MTDLELMRYDLNRLESECAAYKTCLVVLARALRERSDRGYWVPGYAADQILEALGVEPEAGF